MDSFLNTAGIRTLSHREGGGGGVIKYSIHVATFGSTILWVSGMVQLDFTAQPVLECLLQLLSVALGQEAGTKYITLCDPVDVPELTHCLAALAWGPWGEGGSAQVRSHMHQCVR